MRGDIDQSAIEAIGVFAAHAPLPASAFDEAQFGTGSDSFQIEAGVGGSSGDERIRDVPVFVASVEVEAVSDSRVIEKRRGEFGGDAALLIVPAEERDGIQAGAVDVVKGGVNGLEGKAAKK